MTTPTRDEMAFNIGRFRATTRQLIEALEWYIEGPKHLGDCEFSNKADEGCYKCRRAEQDRYIMYYSLLDRAKQLVHESWPDEEQRTTNQRDKAMREDRGYCESCNYEWSPEARPRYCPRCDFPTSSDHPHDAPSKWSEEEWEATMRRAESERPCSNHPLPLTPAEIDALSEQVAAERRIAEYNARAIDWMMERVMGRNTP